MNIPNKITISRIPLLFFVCWLLYTDRRFAPTFAVGFFFLGCFTDWLDGFVARTWHMSSTFGAYLDAVVDKIYVIGIFTTMIVKGIMPNWSTFLMLLILTREFLITALRSIAAAQHVVITAETGGKWKTITQMAAQIVLVAWNCFSKDHPNAFSQATLDHLHVIGMTLFCISSFLTLTSGLRYIYTYRVVLKDC